MFGSLHVLAFTTSSINKCNHCIHSGYCQVHSIEHSAAYNYTCSLILPTQHAHITHGCILVTSDFQISCPPRGALMLQSSPFLQMEIHRSMSGDTRYCMALNSTAQYHMTILLQGVYIKAHTSKVHEFTKKQACR